MSLRMLGILTACFGALLAATRADEADDASAPEVIDPIVAADAFAGTTVKDRTMGMKLIQSRGKKVPKVGQVAPDFELKTANGKQTIRLASFRNKKPVVLIFGSHT